MYQEDDIHECVSGYRFYYNIGVGKILFDDALNPMDYSGYNMKYGDSIEDTLIMNSTIFILINMV